MAANELSERYMTVTEAAKPERAYTLEELVAGITKENRHEEVDFGPAMRSEAW